MGSDIRAASKGIIDTLRERLAAAGVCPQDIALTRMEKISGHEP